MSNVMTFTGKYAFLSTFHRADFEWDGRIYHCCEAAFQSARSLDPFERRRFSEFNGVTARREGKALKPRFDWEMIRDSVMEEIVLAKFSQNPKLAKKLVDTGDMELVYGNRIQETYWGVDEQTGRGENHLGKILMRVRGMLAGGNPEEAVKNLLARREEERLQKKLKLQFQLAEVHEQLRQLPAIDLVGRTFSTRAYGHVTVIRREGNFLVFPYQGTEKRAALPGCITQGTLVPDDPDVREIYRQYGMVLEYMNRLEKMLEAMD